DAGHAVAGVVAAGEQAGAGRRAQRGGVELRVAQPGVDDPVDVRRLDRSAVGAQGREPDVVEYDEEHVRRAVGCARRLERRPVRLGISYVDVDDALERLWQR